MGKRAKEAYRVFEQEVFEHEVAALHARSQRAYLLTLYEPKTGRGAPYVTVQASHSNELHRFANLASAFRYLARLTRLEPETTKKSGP